jgi:aryl-alcohol dehydrogenase-like predicted oxidoreductase
MEYRQLGKSGVRVSVIGLGTNRFGSVVSQEGVNSIIDAAVDLGINLIDTANIYTGSRSEETLGNALKGKWDRFVVATKFGMEMGKGPNEIGASRYHMTQALEASLRRLQSDHVDIYYVHQWDDRTPMEETLRALDDMVRQGKVRYAGASNFASWQVARANLLAEVRGWSPFVVVQEHYHLLERTVEREMLPYCRANQVGLIPYFPLAGGFLTGKYKRGQPAPPGSRGEKNSYVQGYMTDANYDKVEKLSAWAEAHGQTIGALAHAWLLAKPQVCSVISGATKLDHVITNAKAIDWLLTAEEVAEVNAVLAGER